MRGLLWSNSLEQINVTLHASYCTALEKCKGNGASMFSSDSMGVMSVLYSVFMRSGVLVSQLDASVE